MKLLSVVLPAYNEEKMIEKAGIVIGQILEEQKIPYEIVFVDDGSKDGTWSEIERTAQGRVETMLPHMMETAGVTEELKACDPMRWVGLMNTLTAQIEEILIRELICS